MKVILLTDIPKVGNRYDVKDFKEGYANNALIARGLAELATPQALAKLNAYKEKLTRQRQEDDKVFSDLISKVNNKVILLKEKANEKGHLFSSLPKKDIAKVIEKETGLVIEENHIVIPNPIKEVGTHKIKIKKGEREGECTVIVEKA